MTRGLAYARPLIGKPGGGRLYGTRMLGERVKAELWLAAGGGAGSNGSSADRGGSGGGAGGLIRRQLYLPPGLYPIVIGLGGVYPLDGQDSRFGDWFLAKRGGKGGISANATESLFGSTGGLNGSSGGQPERADPVQGYPGRYDTGGPYNQSGAGGGGAGGPTGINPDGGRAVWCPWLGTAGDWVCGGGAGAASPNYGQNTNGVAGANAGGAFDSSPGGNAVANRGGGGGGGYDGDGGDGGSGFGLIAFPQGTYNCEGGTRTDRNGMTIHYFSANANLRVY